MANLRSYLQDSGEMLKNVNQMSIFFNNWRHPKILNKWQQNVNNWQKEFFLMEPAAGRLLCHRWINMDGGGYRHRWKANPASSAAGPSFAGSQWTGSLETGTQRRKGKVTDGRERSTASLSKPIQSKKPPRKEGWLWLFKPKKMSDEELDKWNNEGDRIQWFHAEAKMLRWREQVEMKLAEWQTTIRSFAKYKVTWLALAGQQDPKNTGFIVYAKQQAAIFEQREAKGRTLLQMHTMLSEKYGCITDNALDLLGFVNVRREWDQSKEDNILKPYLVGGGVGVERVDDSDDDDWKTLDGEESKEDEEEAAEEVEGVEEEVGKHSRLLLQVSTLPSPTTGQVSMNARRPCLRTHRPPFLNVPACSAASPRRLHTFATAAASIHTPFAYNGTSIEVLNEHQIAHHPHLQASAFSCTRDRSKSLSVDRPPSATSSHGTSALHSTSTSSASGRRRAEWICQVEREALSAEELLTLHKSASPSPYYEEGDFAGPGSPPSLSHVGNSASALASSTSAKFASTITKDSHSKSASHKSKLEATPSNCAKPAASLWLKQLEQLKQTNRLKLLKCFITSRLPQPRSSLMASAQAGVPLVSPPGLRSPFRCQKARQHRFMRVIGQTHCPVCRSSGGRRNLPFFGSEILPWDRWVQAGLKAVDLLKLGLSSLSSVVIVHMLNGAKFYM
ncbi:hypothetical protein B0H14DRAFT_2582385 [Mycena olivaceomarginata]|nr:hypothetical protein B0H14DRAFT_2582385 [Mycena olivaceomarginata]